ncbi:DUF4339 domain-containing protein [Agrobacterium cavarae]|uniref:DUF4339 domain-containing protein n=1 Tax=Agrobacterium cavarae TaxID=2528239 RepID=UPI0013EF5692|nr:DUF4339 domain-containing protein [Agrobacterium cavarae]
MDSWFYNMGGRRFGPVTESELKSLFADGTISGETLVWNAGAGSDWKRFVEVETFKPTASNAPPPLPPSEVSDLWAWIMALTPAPLLFIHLGLIASIGSGFNRATYLTLSVIVYLSCLAYDNRVVARAGYGRRMRGAGAWMLMTPAAYLIARSKRMGKNPALGYVWIALITLPILLAVVIISQT